MSNGQKAMAGSLAGAALLAAATAAFIGDRPKLAVAALAGAGGAWWYAHTRLQALAGELTAAAQPPGIDPRFVDSLPLLGPLT